MSISALALLALERDLNLGPLPKSTSIAKGYTMIPRFLSLLPNPGDALATR
ncbi:MAG: hypothetical protein J7L51_03470 [Desulfurococcales archaeon]|nr:hypothetical protein [Desulfurococcales archaeon]